MSYKILIVDDDKISQHLIEKLIISYNPNYLIFKAFDFKNAYEIITKNPPNIVIINHNTIKETISEFIKIKQSRNYRNIQIILVDCHLPEKEQIELISKNHVFSIIPKPINPIFFISSLKNAIELSISLQLVDIQKQNIDYHIEELNKLSLIVKETDNCVIIFNPEGNIEWANEAFKKLYGINYEEFIERYGVNIFESNITQENVKEKFEETIETAKSVTYISNIKGIGTISEKWIQTTLTPIFSENEEIEKIVAIQTDVTKLILYELELEKKTKQMEELAEKLKLVNLELQNKNQIILEERKKAEKLLEGILPHHIVSQLKNEGTARPRNYKLATIMFTDFVGFTKECRNLTPEQIVKYLDGFFRIFDDIIIKHYIEKIKTIGDAYMCVGGIPLRNKSNPFNVVLAALEIQYFMNHIDKYAPDQELPQWKLRIGIHSGELVAGVVGKIKFAYDVWGDAVNVASRIQSNCEPGFVNISAVTYEHIKDFFDCQYRGEIEMKNRGQMPMYYVLRIKEEFSEDPEGIFPNEKFKKIINSL